jgi:phospholipid transport system substrate-binding protein
VGGRDEVLVRTEVQPSNGPVIPVNYSLYLQGEQWKAFDVQIDGISLIANYRTNFAAEIRNSGLEVLIQALAAKNRQALRVP